MSNILVTGGAGFLGTHLCKSLLEQDHKVVCVDKLMSGLRTNVADIVKHPNFTFIEADVCNLLDVCNQKSMPKIDQIYNLACPASPPFYQKDHVYTLHTCALGIENVLEIARLNDAKILQASTSEVYGDPLQHPQTEEYRGNVNTVGLRSCYDEGKRFAEAMMFAYNKQYGTNIRIARIFNSYGPLMRLDDGRVITNFIVQALHNEDITVYGDGSQTRSFCYCEDTIRGLQAIMNMREYAGPINVGNPAEITIKEVAETIIDLTNSKSRIIYKDLPTDDPKLRCPDISKIGKLTKWKPKVKFNDGLEKTIEYIKKTIQH